MVSVSSFFRAHLFVSNSLYLLVCYRISVCPIFWGFGAAILFWDLNPLPRVVDGKSAAEQAEELALMRAAELKWACRSLYALIVFSAVAGSFVFALYAIGSDPFAPP